MFSTLRAFTKSWVAILLVGLLIISFAVFGMQDVFRPIGRNAVIEAGSRTVSPAEFKQQFDRYKANAEQQMQRPISMEEAVEGKLDVRFLDEMATRESFFALLEKIGVRASDKLVVDQIRTIPAFFDQVSGRFDQKLFEQRLADNNLTPAGFDQVIRDEIAETHLATAMVNGLRVPRTMSALGAVYSMETRDVGYFPILPGSVEMPKPPTDAELTAFMKENAAQLTRPEFRVLTIVRFSPSLTAAKLPVDEADLQKRYEFRRDTLATPETRSIVQIPAKDQASAVQAAQRLAKGEAPAAVAKALGVEAITYADKPKTAITDRRVAEAAFSLPAGQVSGPIKGELGLAVIKVEKVTPGRNVTLEEIRPQLEAEVRKDAAAEKVYDMTQVYEDARQAGDNMVTAAGKAGVTSYTVGPVTKQGGGQQGQPVPGVAQKLLETAFTLRAGEESDLEDAGEGEFYAVRVDKVIPSALPPLAEVRGELERVWIGRQLVKRMQARADQFAARLRKGETLEAVASAAGSKVTRVVGLDRATAGQNQQLSQSALGKAFSSKPGEVFTADYTQFGLIVGKLESVKVPASPNLARMTEDTRPRLTMALFQELGESGRKAARAKIKVKTDINAARLALGLEPLAPEELKGKAPAKAEKAK